MERFVIQKLAEWKNSSTRKPLVLKGARQVGKTWIMKEFGHLYYEKTFYFNFDQEDSLKQIFEVNKNPLRLIEILGALKEDKILPQKHLIIFDEIQECPEALNSLKYFCEEANEYHIITAGSLPGTLLAKPKSYPVGKVDLLNINPLTFDEFLKACKPNLYDFLETGVEPFYFSPLYNYEIDFLLQDEMQIIPVECKSGKNVTSSSFKRYLKENNPKTAIRFSLLPYKIQDNMINVPLYLAYKLKTILAK